MLASLWIIPALPLLGFLVIAATGARLPHGLASIVGVGSVGLSALWAIVLAAAVLAQGGDVGVHGVTMWTWIDVGGLHVPAALRLDGLSLVMTVVVTVVAFLIHLYSAEHMAQDAGYARFLAYMNLFVAAMLILVLGDNFIFLFAGWEGVGLASYLLIGFWYEEPYNANCARKAFIMTRIGDVAFLVGIVVIYAHLHTLNIADAVAAAQNSWAVGAPVAVWTALLILAGAVGKSAQLPLQTWLPDAMAGPTPVSALLHAATMVTAGVYLIARTHGLFQLALPVMTLVAAIGALTLLLAATSALCQRDIKRVLAYSTMSQIGYMILALGVGAWSDAMFHFMTHACFKALLFLAAGVVIAALDDEHDIFRMGGLKHRLPVARGGFLVGAAALTGVPFVTAGYYSKDAILEAAWQVPLGSLWWTLGEIGVLLTALYAFRVYFIAFEGDTAPEIGKSAGLRAVVPVVVLAILSLIAGFVETPPWLGDVRVFSHVVGGQLGERPASEAPVLLSVAMVVVPLVGIALAYWLFGRGAAAPVRQMVGAPAIARLWAAGWGFDRVYDMLFVRPFRFLARIDRNDVVDRVYGGIALVARGGHIAARQSQTGRVRWYAASLTLGVILLLLTVTVP